MQPSRLIVWLKQLMDIVWYFTLFAVAVFVITLLLPNGGGQLIRHDVRFSFDDGSYRITSNNPAIRNASLTRGSGEIVYRPRGIGSSFCCSW